MPKKQETLVRAHLFSHRQFCSRRCLGSYSFCHHLHFCGLEQFRSSGPLLKTAKIKECYSIKKNCSRCSSSAFDIAYSCFGFMNTQLVLYCVSAAYYTFCSVFLFLLSSSCPTVQASFLLLSIFSQVQHFFGSALQQSPVACRLVPVSSEEIGMDGESTSTL